MHIHARSKVEQREATQSTVQPRPVLLNSDLEQQARTAFLIALAAAEQARAAILSALVVPKQAQTALSSALLAPEQARAALSSFKQLPCCK